MTQEGRELLLQDLCARLPHGVKVSILGGGAMELQACIHSSNIGWYFDIKDAPTDFALDEIKPYLRLMSSMTEEEKAELAEEQKKDEDLFLHIIKKSQEGDDSFLGTAIPHYAEDWANKNYFDYRGLIPMGLALEAKEGMYKIE